MGCGIWVSGRQPAHHLTARIPYPFMSQRRPAVARQHVIDPEICIRCNTCEATCPEGAVTHNDRNYVVRFESCNACGACISPCPTGAIDNWRQVMSSRA